MLRLELGNGAAVRSIKARLLEGDYLSTNYIKEVIIWS